MQVHVVITAEGNPVEVSLAPGSCNGEKHLRTFEVDLPEQSGVLVGTGPVSSTSSRSIARKSLAGFSGRPGGDEEKEEQKEIHYCPHCGADLTAIPAGHDSEQESDFSQ